MYVCILWSVCLSSTSKGGWVDWWFMGCGWYSLIMATQHWKSWNWGCSQPQGWLFQQEGLKDSWRSQWSSVCVGSPKRLFLILLKEFHNNSIEELTCKRTNRQKFKFPSSCPFIWAAPRRCCPYLRWVFLFQILLVPSLSGVPSSLCFSWVQIQENCNREQPS